MKQPLLFNTITTVAAKVSAASGFLVTKLLSAILICLSFPAAAFCAEAPGRLLQSRGSWGIGLNYPGVSVRYFPADGRGLELLGQSQDKVFAGGLRYYVYPVSLRSGPVSPYFALEGDYFSFKGSYAKGAGWGCGAYAGAEYRLAPRISMQADLGAMYVSLTDRSTDLSEGGLEFLLNLGFNLYFGGGGK